MQLDVLQPVDCVHLSYGVCLAATAATGVEVPVTPPVCHVTCQNNGGPYLGRIAPTPQRWFGEMMYSHRNSYRKVRKRYAGGVTAVVPTVRNAVLAAYQPLLAENPWIMSVGLTGSILFADQGTPRDLDVVLIVTDYEDWLAERGGLVGKLPTVVAGLRVDLWVKQAPLAGPFAVLDLQSLTLYTPSAYKVLGHDHGIILNPAAGVTPTEGILPVVQLRAPVKRRERDRRAAPMSPAGTTIRKPLDWGTLGPKMWGELHTKIGPDRAWLDGFAKRIPCGVCKGHWLGLMTKNPPVFGDGWFRWTVDRHNDVNRRLGKPTMAVTYAAMEWKVAL